MIYSLALGALICLIMTVFGEFYVIPFAGLVFGFWLIREVFTHRYMSKHSVHNIIDNSASKSTKDQNDQVTLLPPPPPKPLCTFAPLHLKKAVFSVVALHLCSSVFICG
jgi:hypothetical protein